MRHTPSFFAFRRIPRPCSFARPVASAPRLRGQTLFRRRPARELGRALRRCRGRDGRHRLWKDPSLVRPAIGLAAGGLLGSAFGAGTGRTLFVIGGGLDYRTRSYKGVQLPMELDNGNILMVVQGHEELFVRGDEVRIIII